MCEVRASHLQYVERSAMIDDLEGESLNGGVEKLRRTQSNKLL